jgi:hypothetical protein
MDTVSSISEITAAGMLESATAGALANKGDSRASQQVQFVGAAARMEPQDGTAQWDWGVLDSEADRPKVIFLQKR